MGLYIDGVTAIPSSRFIKIPKYYIHAHLGYGLKFWDCPGHSGTLGKYIWKCKDRLIFYPCHTSAASDLLIIKPQCVS